MRRSALARLSPRCVLCGAARDGARRLRAARAVALRRPGRPSRGRSGLRAPAARGGPRLLRRAALRAGRGSGPGTAATGPSTSTSARGCRPWSPGAGIPWIAEAALPGATPRRPRATRPEVPAGQRGAVRRLVDDPGTRPRGEPPPARRSLAARLPPERRRCRGRERAARPPRRARADGPDGVRALGPPPDPRRAHPRRRACSRVPYRLPRRGCERIEARGGTRTDPDRRRRRPVAA